MTPFYFFFGALALMIMFITLLALYPLLIIWRKQTPQPSVVVTPAGSTTTVTTTNWYNTDLLVGTAIVAIIMVTMLLSQSWGLIGIPDDTRYRIPGMLIFSIIAALIILLIKRGNLTAAIIISSLIILAWVIAIDGILSDTDIALLLIAAAIVAGWRGYLGSTLIVILLFVAALVYWLGPAYVMSYGRSLGSSLVTTSENISKVVVPANGCVIEDNTDPRYYFLGQPEDPARGFPKTFIKEDTGSKDWIPYVDGDRFVFIKWCGDQRSDQVMIVTRTLM